MQLTNFSVILWNPKKIYHRIYYFLFEFLSIAEEFHKCVPLPLAKFVLLIRKYYNLQIVPSMILSIIAACTIVFYLPLSILQIASIDSVYYDATHRLYTDEFCSTCEYKIKWYIWESCSRCFGAFVVNDNYREEVRFCLNN